ncbi:uncharacterized protein LOC111361060 [Spodoptera litura]|uniref:Uncharacterized protein LOC111361060 n=1 Tax=Spodoptera litura TaxID=69820 RepID=A0A9J7ES11_SPOLT|nr:uncharacterized protein LOC111361060 [Spodoptera litura]
MCDASNTCVGAALQQYIQGRWQPLGFFSKKLNDAQKKYSTYDRELIAIYLAIRHFRRMFEGKEITVFTDHKPLTFALLRNNSKTETPMRTRYLHYISQFTSKILHIEGKDNVVADALSRIDTITSPSPIDYDELARQQQVDTEIKEVILLDDWLGRKHGSLSFRVTQVLSGHGCFGKYLCRIEREPDARCHHCVHCGEDTAQHTLAECVAWEEQRRVLRNEVGSDLSLPAVVRKMVDSAESWDAVVSFCEDVMSQKETAEREREILLTSFPNRRRRTGRRRRADNALFRPP